MKEARITPKYIEILNEHLMVRKEFNSQYSLRSFARDIGLAPSNLSSILNGKKGLSKRSASEVASLLKLNDSEWEVFVSSAAAIGERSKKQRSLAQEEVKRLHSDVKTINEDYFRLISNWHYFAILELMLTNNFKSHHGWIAKRLNLTKEAVDQAMPKLLRLELIKQEGDKYVHTAAPLFTGNNLPSHSIKKHNMQILSKAKDALLEQDLDEREVTTLTIAVKKDHIPFVKEKIRSFRNELDKELMKKTKTEGADEVYCLAVQFFNLSKGDIQ